MTVIKSKLAKRVACTVLSFGLMFAYFPGIVSASQIADRSVTIGSSIANASTTYSFTFSVPSVDIIKSVGFAACTTPSGLCTPVAGFSASSSTLTSQPVNLGDSSGWTISTADPAELRLSNATNATAPVGAQSVVFSGVTNPSSTNITFFVRITTYSDSSWTNPVDIGVVASSTAGQVTVTASVGEILTFTLDTSTVSLGALSTSTTGSGISAMTVATNATNGYSVSYKGDTLTSGTNTITALSSPTPSSMNSKQFGINLMNNTTPAIGLAKAGSGSGLPSIGYNVADLFKFNSGDTVASAVGPTNSNVFTVSYIANIDGITAPGAYSAVINYTATTNF